MTQGATRMIAAIVETTKKIRNILNSSGVLDESPYPLDITLEYRMGSEKIGARLMWESGKVTWGLEDER